MSVPIDALHGPLLILFVWMKCNEAETCGREAARRNPVSCLFADNLKRLFVGA